MYGGYDAVVMELESVNQSVNKQISFKGMKIWEEKEERCFD